MSAYRPLALPDGARIGLLGGSFNPAHEGHRHISLIAMRRLNLDRVIWLVTPQNPLKASGETSALETRMSSARTIANHSRIEVSDLEHHIGTVYTADTLAWLVKHYGRVHFVWLMGADNLVQFSQWKNWQGIMNTMPVAVIARPGYSVAARFSKMAHTYSRHRLDQADAALLPLYAPPAWTFIQERLSALSASDIRDAQASHSK